MKKKLPTRLLIVFTLMLPGMTFAQRYLTEVFPSATVTASVQYGENYSVFPPPGINNIPLMMDVYEPTGDGLPSRPLIIFMHTGSYLPKYINGTPTGSRNDSATVEICKRFARRGYVVANMDYRLGWNPAGSNVDIRRGTLLNAVYRSIQDAKACVRFFRKDAATTNLFKIDTNNVIIGGQGTGGYIALNYACLDKPAEISLPKFISGITDANYGFVAGQPYVNQAVLGDFDGYGGMAGFNNPNNSPGFGNDVQFVFNMGGALGDSTWLEAGDAPMVVFHVIGDPFAPYDQGIVFVPGNPPQSVVDVVGSKYVITRANQLNNNACFANAGFTDPFTAGANVYNQGQEGLYPFATVPAVQAGPWEWFDSTAVVTEANAIGQNGPLIYSNALLTNPNMSKMKAMAYIDTVMGYLNPRIVYCLNLQTGIKDITNGSFSIAPNPATDAVFINLENLNGRIETITLIDLTGRELRKIHVTHEKRYSLDRGNLAAGTYFIKVNTDHGEFVNKLIFR